ncbi:hypothetical protein [Spiroplasma culicicola]|uniref:Uncharacterized protein n=1 Tax=Spiroplasma culicicola AES-1 TaxID=1276246 RepID=W6A6T5_9MOLU|nr:hypothetical protein [Spiroplasma culicicola]AHI52823.1 hypothetical protein SCULI_v1c04820 [Spiroplasma culicicola AES-1]
MFLLNIRWLWKNKIVFWLSITLLVTSLIMGGILSIVSMQTTTPEQSSFLEFAKVLEFVFLTVVWSLLIVTAVVSLFSGQINNGIHNLEIRLGYKTSTSFFYRILSLYIYTYIFFLITFLIKVLCLTIPNDFGYNFSYTILLGNYSFIFLLVSLLIIITLFFDLLIKGILSIIIVWTVSIFIILSPIINMFTFVNLQSSKENYSYDVLRTNKIEYWKIQSNDLKNILDNDLQSWQEDYFEYITEFSQISANNIYAGDVLKDSEILEGNKIYDLLLKINDASKVLNNSECNYDDFGFFTRVISKKECSLTYGYKQMINYENFSSTEKQIINSYIKNTKLFQNNIYGSLNSLLADESISLSQEKWEKIFIGSNLYENGYSSILLGYTINSFINTFALQFNTFRYIKDELNTIEEYKFLEFLPFYQITKLSNGKSNNSDLTAYYSIYFGIYKVLPNRILTYKLDNDELMEFYSSDRINWNTSSLESMQAPTFENGELILRDKDIIWDYVQSSFKNNIDYVFLFFIYLLIPLVLIYPSYFSYKKTIIY